MTDPKAPLTAAAIAAAIAANGGAPVMVRRTIVEPVRCVINHTDGAAVVIPSTMPLAYGPLISDRDLAAQNAEIVP